MMNYYTFSATNLSLFFVLFLSNRIGIVPLLVVSSNLSFCGTDISEKSWDGVDIEAVILFQ
jgi:hypothetical protein